MRYPFFIMFSRFVDCDSVISQSNCEKTLRQARLYGMITIVFVPPGNLSEHEGRDML